MRILFLLVVLANAVFFAVHQGYFGKLIADGREPERIGNQQQPERIKPISQRQFDALSMSPLPADVQMVGSSRVSPDVLGASLQGKECIEFGGFANQDLKRFEALLPPLQLGERLTQRSAEEQTNWAVFIPPFKTRAEAEKKAEELHRLGLTDFFIILDESNFRFAISFGIFKTEESARSHLATLSKKGVRTAQTGNRSVTLSKTWFQFHKMDTALLDKLVAIRPDYPNQELLECEAKQ